ncbi:MAG: hypothetical protein HRT36_02600 [Alphaproteobacteria bacterium]|nr:hypothetical protein [Alphaproteobacteria bacterium]
MAEEKKQPKVIIIPAPIWLLSFGDTIALMLAFFVMLFAMSSVEESNVSRLIASISSENPDDFLPRPVPNSNLSIENIRVYNGLSLDYIYQLLEEKIGDIEALQNVKISNQHDSVVISLPPEIFVSSSHQTIGELGQKVLFELGLILAPISNMIQVEGHNPPQPISQSHPFSNRWEMRLLRSTAVAQAIRRAGLLSSTKVLGWPLDNYSDTKANRALPLPTGDERVDLRITKIAGGQ